MIVVTGLAAVAPARPGDELRGDKSTEYTVSDGHLELAHLLLFLQIYNHAACEVPHERQCGEYSVIETFNCRPVQ